MKLESIVLNGFKSFADKTEFCFDQNITAIVGPNGCGKSNVVDAVKWVLGDQSPKSLRGGQMADVIFSGSASRKPSGMAHVDLHFSQVAGIGIEQDELEISRRLYRSGESEYMINGKSCRLKDIRELFMDTGIGVKAYSIIEQGQIEQLLHASKTDRRAIFEEAAGISKFKAHKKEALRKLDRTEQNLLRLADIVGEVQKQLRSVKLQAGKARNYLLYSDRLKELRVNFSLAEYDKISRQSSEKKLALSGFEEKFSVICAAVARDDAALSRLGKDIIDSEGQINQWDNSLVAAKSKIEQQTERIEFLRKRTEELEERKTSLTEQISQLEAQSIEFVNELAGSKEQIAENEKTLAEKNTDLEILNEDIKKINSQCGDIEATLADEKSGIIDIVRRTAQLHNEISSIGTYRNNLSGQKSRLSDRAGVAKQQLEQLLTEKVQHQAKLGDINKVIDQLQETLESKRTESAQMEDRQKDLTVRLTDAKENRSALASEYDLLGDMETRREGLSDSIKEILAVSSLGDGEKFGYVEGIVADIISAQPKYAAAVEAALEGRTDALVVSDTAGFLADEDIQAKLQSRVKVICADRIGPFADSSDMSNQQGVLGRVVEFVDYDSKYAPLVWELLGRTILTETLNDAIRLSESIGTQYRFVSMAGEVLQNGYSMSLGPVGRKTGLISRKSRLGQLETLLAEIETGISDIETELEKNKQQGIHIAKLCKDLRTAVYEANTEKVDTESRLGFLEENIKRLSGEQPLISSEIESLENQIRESVQKSHDSQQALTELDTVNAQRNAHIAELEEQFIISKQQQAQHNESFTELKVQIGQAQEIQRSLQHRITTLNAQLQQSRSGTESAGNELTSCCEQMTEADRDILAGEAKISELFVEKENAQQVSNRMHKEVAEMISRQAQLHQELKDSRASQSEVEQQMNEVKIALGQLSVKNEDLSERVADELGIDLAQAYEDFEQEDVDWEQVREEISQLRGKIERLGNVNVDAIAECDELAERYEFLATQVEDINKSKSQLEQLINKINAQSREKFRVTFEEVRQNFQIVFRKLFGGGKADVFLEDPDDLLDSGIEILAKPPGKETRSLSLLSGGEKSLTAISLLFAVFKSKPSPFCFLDEVDAALDEANIERFNLIVKEFQKNSQFIIVTHSKRTMSMADVLFGVTMQTQGVSKKISVKFDRLDEETDAAVA